jgi:hypothetical protein
MNYPHKKSEVIPLSKVNNLQPIHRQPLRASAMLTVDDMGTDHCGFVWSSLGGEFSVMISWSLKN